MREPYTLQVGRGELCHRLSKSPIIHVCVMNHVGHDDDDDDDEKISTHLQETNPSLYQSARGFQYFDNVYLGNI